MTVSGIDANINENKYCTLVCPLYRLGITGEKGIRSEPGTVTAAVCTEIYIFVGVKSGHWETEKAEYINAKFLLYMV